MTWEPETTLAVVTVRQTSPDRNHRIHVTSLWGGQTVEVERWARDPHLHAVATYLDQRTPRHYQIHQQGSHEFLVDIYPSRAEAAG